MGDAVCNQSNCVIKHGCVGGWSGWQIILMIQFTMWIQRCSPRWGMGGGVSSTPNMNLDSGLILPMVSNLILYLPHPTCKRWCNHRHWASMPSVIDEQMPWVVYALIHQRCAKVVCGLSWRWNCDQASTNEMFSLSRQGQAFLVQMFLLLLCWVERTTGKCPSSKWWKTRLPLHRVSSIKHQIQVRGVVLALLMKRELPSLLEKLLLGAFLCSTSWTSAKADTMKLEHCTG